MSTDEGTAERRRWMAVLARAETGRLAEVAGRLGALDEAPGLTWLRAPEIGMAMVRGRAGGRGLRFNLGEMTVTRAAVRLGDGPVGVAYVAGRDKRKAGLAAVLDAVLQDGGAPADAVRAEVAALAASQAAAREGRAAKSAATRVNFFTMVRGDNPR